MSDPCTKADVIERMDAKLDKLIELQVDNAVIHETLETQGKTLEKIDQRLTVVEARPMKMLKWGLTVVTPVLSAVMIYVLVG